MSQPRLKPAPQPDQLWMSTPPYLMIARVLAVEEQADGGSVVSYKLYDENGYCLEHVDHLVEPELRREPAAEHRLHVAIDLQPYDRRELAVTQLDLDHLHRPRHLQ